MSTRAVVPTSITGHGPGRDRRIAPAEHLHQAPREIAGFDVLDCASLDETLEVAAKHPVARFGSIDVRPFWE
jgi:hypothetical protein